MGARGGSRKFYRRCAFVLAERRSSENETRMHYTWIAGDINFLPRTWSGRAAAAALVEPRGASREGKLARGTRARLRARGCARPEPLPPPPSSISVAFAVRANFFFFFLFSRRDFDEWQGGAPRESGDPRESARGTGMSSRRGGRQTAAYRSLKRYRTTGGDCPRYTLVRGREDSVLRNYSYR